MAFETPNTIINDSIKEVDTILNSSSASFGKIVRSKPIIPPTKALTINNRLNCCQFSFNPNCIVSVFTN